jgi:hypothetical protein
LNYGGFNAKILGNKKKFTGLGNTHPNSRPVGDHGDTGGVCGLKCPMNYVDNIVLCKV